MNAKGQMEQFRKRFGTDLQNFSKEKLSEALSWYLGKPAKATALVEGCNVSNGYPYFIIFFDEV